eukprot:528528_1
MELLQLLHGRKDGVLEASLSAHGLRRIVEVAPCSVPVAWDGLRFEGTDHRKLLTDPVHQVAGDREMVPGRNALRGAHLVLPLPGHDLCVDAGDLHSGIQARLVVCLHNIAPERIQGPNATVVHPLRGWEPRGGPAQGGPPVGLEECVFLFHAIPGLLFHHLGVRKDLRDGVPGVGGDWVALGGVAVAEDQDVVAAAKGVCKEGTGLDDDLRILAGCLPSGRSVEVPVGELGRGAHGLLQCLALASKVVPSTPNPNVLSHHAAPLVQPHVLRLGAMLRGGRVLCGVAHCSRDRKGGGKRERACLLLFLAGRRAVEVPIGKLVRGAHGLLQCL